MAKRKAKDSLDANATLLASNRKAGFDYELGDRFEAGLVLLGSEIKSIRQRLVGITEAWVAVRDNQAYVEGMRVQILQHAAFGHTSETRSRKLLLHRKEITTLRNAIERGGMTVVATRLYLRDGRAKLEIAIARGKKAFDKREAIKDRDAQRDAQREIAKRQLTHSK